MVLLFDILISVIVLGLIAAGIGLVKEARTRTVKGRVREAQRLGQANADRMLSRLELVCAECTKEVNPAEDVFISPHWYHKKCYLEINSGL